MKRTYTIILTMCVVALFATTQAFAQEDGDYRSAGVGDWSDAGIWEVYNGTDWVDATEYPDGSADMTITIAGSDTVTVDSGVSSVVEGEPVDGQLVIRGYLSVHDSAVLEVGDGNLVFFFGSTYEHARNEGSIPEADWWEGSTIMLTGITTNDPDNSDQGFSNFIWDNAGQLENINVGWDDYTLTGDLTVLNTNGNQFRMTSAGDTTRTITINGNVTVDGENTEFTTTGSGGLADYNITVLGDVRVTNGAFLSASRGSSGRAVWTLYGDSLIVTDAQLGDSEDHEQTESFVFAADTVNEGEPVQTISINGISYDGATHFRVADSSAVLIAAGSEFIVESSFVNEGVIEVEEEATLVFDGDEAVYEHARNGGEVPTATWEEGSTALFTGITTDGPDNADQDFYNLVLNSPGNSENNDLGMDGNTISGDIQVVSTGSARLYLTSPSSDPEVAREITVMGDITMESGAFSTNGSSGSGPINVHHYGDITVNDGNFSVSRGSGPIVSWYMYEGDLTFNGGESQSSNARAGNAFIFTGADTVTHTLTLSEDFDMSALPVVVDTGATLDIGTSDFSDSGENFTVRAGATIATADTAGFGDNLSLGGSGDTQLTLSQEANYVYNGTEAQETGTELPLTVASVTIDNEAGVTQTRMITITDYLRLASGELDNTIGFILGDDAEIIVEEGTLLVPAYGVGVDVPEPPYAVGDTINYNGSFAQEDLGETTEVEMWSLSNAEEADATFEVIEGAQDDDSRALQVTVGTFNNGDDWNVGATNESLNVVEDDIYEASVYLKADADTNIANLYFGAADSESDTRFEETDAELGTEWQEYTVSYTATADDEEQGLQFSIALNFEENDGATIYIDNLTITKVDVVSNEIVEGIPSDFALEQNYPNPFNPTTNIQYNVPEQSHVTLKVYDITGREVAELVNKNHSAGVYTQAWDASKFASGVYIYRITAGDFTAVRKLTLIK